MSERPNCSSVLSSDLFMKPADLARKRWRAKTFWGLLSPRSARPSLGCGRERLKTKSQPSSARLIAENNFNATRFLLHGVNLVVRFGMGNALLHAVSSMHLCLLAEAVNQPFLDSSSSDMTLRHI